LINEFSKAALKGKVIGVQRATTHDRYIEDNYSNDTTIKRYGSQDELYLDILSGRIDLFLADSIVSSESFLKKAKGKDFEFVGPGLYDAKWFGIGVGIAVRKEDQELRKILNAAIDRIRADGTYRTIQDKYFDVDVYGD